MFRVLIPDNLKPVVNNADAVNPQLSVGWLDYAQHCGFGTDPARVRSSGQAAGRAGGGLIQVQQRAHMPAGPSFESPGFGQPVAVH